MRYSAASLPLPTAMSAAEAACSHRQARDPDVDMSGTSHLFRFRAREVVVVRDVRRRSRIGRRGADELTACAAFGAARATTHRTKSSTIQSRLGAWMGNEFQGMNCSSKTTTSGSAGPSMHAGVRVCRPSTVLQRCSALGSGMPRRSCSLHRCREAPHACQRSFRPRRRAFALPLACRTAMWAERPAHA